MTRKASWCIAARWSRKVIGRMQSAPPSGSSLLPPPPPMAAPPSGRVIGCGAMPDGLLYFAGRRDAMIKSAGNRISPQEVEDAALATGLVAEAVALGVADARLGQAVHLVVRGAGELGDDEAARADLAKRLQRDLPNFMQPAVIHWRKAMPLNPNGKIDRSALQIELNQEFSS